MGFLPESLEESQLKVATLYYDRLILPVNHQLLDRVKVSFAEQEDVPQTEVSKAWIAVDEVCRNCDPKILCSQLILPDDKRCWDKRGNIRSGLRGAIDRSIVEHLNLTDHGLRKLKKQNW